MGSRRGGGGADWPWAHGAQLRVCVLRVYCGRRWPRAPSGHPSARTGLCGILLPGACPWWGPGGHPGGERPTVRVPGAAVAISCVRDDPLRVLCAHQLRTKNYERLVSYLLGRTDARHLGHATQTPVSRDEKHTAGPCRCSSDMRPSNKQK